MNEKINDIINEMLAEVDKEMDDYRDRIDFNNEDESLMTAEHAQATVETFLSNRYGKRIAEVISVYYE